MRWAVFEPVSGVRHKDVAQDGVRAAGAVAAGQDTDKKLPMMALAAGRDSMVAQRTPNRLTASNLWTMADRRAWAVGTVAACAPAVAGDLYSRDSRTAGGKRDSCASNWIVRAAEWRAEDALLRVVPQGAFAASWKVQSSIQKEDDRLHPGWPSDLTAASSSP